MTLDFPATFYGSDEGQVRLEIGKWSYANWTSASFSRSLETFASAFTVQGSKSFPHETNQVGFRPGDLVRLYLDDRLAMTGYIDTVEFSHDGTVSVSGRSKTGQLVDCSAQTFSIKKTSFLQAAKILAAPYNVSVDGEQGPKMARFIIPRGDTVWAALDKRAVKAGLLCLDTETGDLVVTKAGTLRAVTTVGPSAISSKVTFSMTGRFRRYETKGAIADDPPPTGASAVDALGGADDEECPLERLLIIRAKGLGNRDDALRHARWEAATRYGKSTTLVYTLPGWTMADGNLWWVNQLADVQDERHNINGEYLIVSARYTKDANGTQTELTLHPPQAFLAEPIPKGKNGNKNVWIPIGDKVQPFDPNAFTADETVGRTPVSGQSGAP